MTEAHMQEKEEEDQLMERKEEKFIHSEKLSFVLLRATRKGSHGGSEDSGEQQGLELVWLLPGPFPLTHETSLGLAQSVCQPLI